MAARPLQPQDAPGDGRNAAAELGLAPATRRGGSRVRSVELDTPHGPARARLLPVSRARAAIVLGHGAGGGIDTPDLAATAAAATETGVAAALLEQPYRVAGRRNQPPARQLDAAWLAAIAELRASHLAGLPLIAGGRSAGARVACRTAAEAGAIAVLCLAFPLHPPGRAEDPARSRLPELEAVQVPVLVVQGQRDPFGIPPAGRRRKVIRVPGTHTLRNPEAIRAAVGDWLARLL